MVMFVLVRDSVKVIGSSTEITRLLFNPLNGRDVNWLHLAI